MTEKKQNSVFSFYIPIVLIVSFMLGCLGVSLINVLENAMQITYNGSVSSSDAAANRVSVRKSPVMDDAGLRYRMVSASDLRIKKEESEPKKAADTSSEDDPFSSDTASGISSETPSDNPDASQEETVSSGAEETVSSEPAVSEEPEEFHLELPNDHFINFTPHREGYVAYLTFDDGPSEYTDKILDILDYYNAKATFFVIYHKDMEDQYKEIVRRGHTIGLHTYTHKYEKIYRSETAFFNEIKRIQNYIYNLTGTRTRIIRFPGGSSNTVSRHYCEGIMDTLKKSVPSRGYVYHDWNVDSCDAEHYNLAPEKLLENVKKDLTKYRKPDILMHDAGESKRTTVEALPMIIEYIYSKGYSLEGLQLDSYAVHHDW